VQSYPFSPVLLVDSSGIALTWPITGLSPIVVLGVPYFDYQLKPKEIRVSLSDAHIAPRDRFLTQDNQQHYDSCSGVFG
jgi:hypothetical protein